MTGVGRIYIKDLDKIDLGVLEAITASFRTLTSDTAEEAAAAGNGLDPQPTDRDQRAHQSIFVEIAGRRIRAARRSAQWLHDSIDALWRHIASKPPRDGQAGESSSVVVAGSWWC